jgi:hypothetical protein
MLSKSLITILILIPFTIYEEPLSNKPKHPREGTLLEPGCPWCKRPALLRQRLRDSTWQIGCQASLSDFVDSKSCPVAPGIGGYSTKEEAVKVWATPLGKVKIIDPPPKKSTSEGL